MYGPGASTNNGTSGRTFPLKAPLLVTVNVPFDFAKAYVPAGGIAAILTTPKLVIKRAQRTGRTAGTLIILFRTSESSAQGYLLPERLAEIQRPGISRLDFGMVFRGASPSC